MNKYVVYCNYLLRCYDIVVSANDSKEALEKGREKIENRLKNEGFTGDLTKFYTLGKARLLTSNEIKRRREALQAQIAELQERLNDFN